MTNPMPNPVRRGDRVLLWLLESLGVALASAAIAAVGGIGMMFFFKELLAVVLGFLWGTGLAATFFWSRRWVVMTAALAAALLISIPLFTPGHRESPSAEAEQMLGSMKGRTRVAYAKLGTAANIRTLTGPVGQGGCGVAPGELQGKYFRVRDEVIVTETSFTLFADPIPGHERMGTCTLTFKRGGGDGVFTWTPP